MSGPQTAPCGPHNGWPGTPLALTYNIRYSAYVHVRLEVGVGSAE